MSRLDKVHEARVVKHTLCDDIRKRLMTNPSGIPCQATDTHSCVTCCLSLKHEQTNIVSLMRLLDE